MVKGAARTAVETGICEQLRTLDIHAMDFAGNTVLAPCSVWATIAPHRAMNSRILLLAVLAFFAGASVAPAADLCRVRGRHSHKLGNEPSTKTVHTPRKRTPGAQSVSVHSKNRGPYPYNGKRRTPKRTYL